VCPRYDVVLLYSNLNHLFQNLAFCISHPFQTWWHWCVDSRTEKKIITFVSIAGNQYIPCKFLPWPLHMIIFIMKRTAWYKILSLISIVGFMLLNATFNNISFISWRFWFLYVTMRHYIDVTLTNPQWTYYGW
jgi:hypothetical protein